MQMAAIFSEKKMRERNLQLNFYNQNQEIYLKHRLLFFHCRELDDNLISSLPEGLSKLSQLQEL